MKLELVFLCCLSLMLSISSVAQEASEAPPPIQNKSLESAPEAPLESVRTTLSEAQFGYLDSMVARGEIRVLTDFKLG